MKQNAPAVTKIKEALRQALAAAAEKGERSYYNYLRHLADSGFMDVAMRRLLRRVGDNRGPTEDDPDGYKYDNKCYDILAGAIDKVYLKISEKGEEIYRGKDPLAFLWTVVKNTQTDSLRERVLPLLVEISQEDEEDEGAEGSSTIKAPKLFQRKDVYDVEEWGRESRRDAVRAARDLLPELGEENVQKVMELYFDAVEKEVPLSHMEVAEITGLQVDTVKQYRKRGFDRLKREVERAGGATTVLREARLDMDDLRDEEG